MFLSDFSKKEVLVFTRFSKDYAKILSEIMYGSYNVSSFKTISEYKGKSDHYIDLNNVSLEDISTSDYELINKIDVIGVIQRDRWLRTVAYSAGVKEVLVSIKFFIDFYRANSYQVVFTQIVDSYVMEVMARVGRLLGIEVVGGCDFFVGGYNRITLFGEHKTIRSPSDREVEEVFGFLLDKKFKSSMVPSHTWMFRRAILLYFQYKAKQFVHGLVYSRLLNKKEYRYLAYDETSPYPTSLRHFFVRRNFVDVTQALTWIEEDPESRVVYVPLHYFPEATVEYWVDKPEKADYHLSLIKTLRFLLDKGYRILLKEHPSIVYSRHPDFYKSIFKLGENRIIIVNPFVSTRSVVDKVDTVVVWTGSTGIEAAILGKKVVKVSESYYTSGFEFSELDKIDSASPLPVSQRKDLLRHILSGMVPIS